MISPTHFKEVPVSLFLATSLIVVFLLYTTTIIKSVPCNKDLVSVFYGNFVHIDIYHLVGNIFALYALARVEIALGAINFFGLIIFLIIFNSLVEILIYKLIPGIKCGVGFSGVLFGIMTWELVTNRKLDYILVVSIIFMVILPSFQNKNASLLGHSVGAFTGIIGGLIWVKTNEFLKNRKKNISVTKIKY